jgi:hypothetical protein
MLWLGFNGENLVDIGEAIGILAGQSIGEPQLHNCVLSIQEVFYI